MKSSSPIYFGFALAGHALALFAIPEVSDNGSKPLPASPIYLEVTLKAPPVEPAPTAQLVATPPRAEPPAQIPDPQPPTLVETVPPRLEKVVEEPPPEVEEKIAPSAASEPQPPAQPPLLNALVSQPALEAPRSAAIALPRAGLTEERSPYIAVEEPSYRKRGRAEYPVQARRLKQEGVVWLTLYINPQGGLDRLEVKESSGFPLLDQAAVEAEKKSRFQPAYARGKPVASKVEVPYRFQLK